MIMIQEEAQGHLPAANRGARAQENAMESQGPGADSNPAAQAGVLKRVQAAIEVHEAQIPRDREASGKQEEARTGVPVATE